MLSAISSRFLSLCTTKPSTQWCCAVSWFLLSFYLKAGRMCFLELFQCFRFWLNNRGFRRWNSQQWRDHSTGNPYNNQPNSTASVRCRTPVFNWTESIWQWNKRPFVSPFHRYPATLDHWTNHNGCTKSAFPGKHVISCSQNMNLALMPPV